MRTIRGLLLLLAAFSVQAQGSTSSSLHSLWGPYITPDEACPRYILVNLGKDGMGDQLERLSMGLALAIKHQGFTVVVSEPLGHHSLHDKTGRYKNVYHDTLGLPEFPQLSDVLARHAKNSWKILRRRVPKQSEYLSYLRGEANMRDKEACNVLLDVDVYDVCNSWCPFIFGWEVQAVIKRLLRSSYSYAGRRACNDYAIRNNIGLMKFVSASDSELASGATAAANTVNVVWHVRRPALKTDESQMNCRTCSDGYFDKVLKILSGVTTGSSGSSGSGGSAGAAVGRNRTMFHSIITNIDKDSQHALLEKEMYTKTFGKDFRLLMGDVKEAVCTALTADILISTGSTFASALALFTPQHQPLLLEEQRHTKHLTDQHLKWFTDAADSYHLVDGELVLPRNASAPDGATAAPALVVELMKEQLLMKEKLWVAGAAALPRAS